VVAVGDMEALVLRHQLAAPIVGGLKPADADMVVPVLHHQQRPSMLGWARLAALGTAEPAPLRLPPTDDWKFRWIAHRGSVGPSNVLTSPPERMMQMQRGPDC